MSWIEITEEGTVEQRITNDPKYRALQKRIYDLEDALKLERRQHGETKEALQAATERVSRIIVEKVRETKEKAYRKKAGFKQRTRKGVQPDSARNEEQTP